MSAETDASILASTTSTINTATNAIAQSNLNRRTQKWNEKQYDKARTDNMSDWNKQNEYNSPAAQMARLKAAGLNPNLVYDNGAATVSAQAVKSADTPAWNPKAPEYNFSSGINAYYDAQIKTATIDNLKQQFQNMEAEKALKEAQAINTNANTASTLQGTSTAGRLADISVQAAAANLNKTITETGTTIDANTRANMMIPGQLQQQIESVLSSRLGRAKTEEEIKQIKQQIQNLKADETLKNLDFSQRKDNLSNNDPWYVKALTKILAHYGISIDDLPTPKKPDETRPGTSAEYWKKAFPNSPLNHLFK